jgi:hypothetical protein
MQAIIRVASLLVIYSLFTYTTHAETNNNLNLIDYNKQKVPAGANNGFFIVDSNYSETSLAMKELLQSGSSFFDIKTDEDTTNIEEEAEQEQEEEFLYFQSQAEFYESNYSDPYDNSDDYYMIEDNDSNQSSIEIQENYFEDFQEESDGDEGGGSL